MSYLLSSRDIEHWESTASRAPSVSSLLRQISDEYGFNKYQTASAAAEIFEERISGEDRQVLWKWRFFESDEGFDDAEIDELLAHLL